MPDIRLLVSDFDPASPDHGQLSALDTANASGIPLPAFRYGPARPVTGTTAGEGFLNTTSHEASIWTGNRWEPISPPAINIYPNDSAVLADTGAAPGVYGTSQATGNLYIRTNTGWKLVGVRTYPTLAGLWADAPADGSIGVDMASSSIWLRVNGAWVPQSPVSYNTEALLMAQTPRNSEIGIAEDTGLLYVGVNGVWRRANSPTMTVAPARPATPAVGDLWFDNATGTGMVWSGAQWMSMNAEPIGEIKMWPTWTPPPNFLLCDGSVIPAQYPALIALIGPTTPDLTGQFIRGARNAAEITGFAKQRWTTGRPRAAFTTDNQGNHTHTIYQQSWAAYDSGGAGTQQVRSASSNANQTSAPAGGHTHTITGGGDAETAPDNVRLAFIVRAA